MLHIFKVLHKKKTHTHDIHTERMRQRELNIYFLFALALDQTPQ